MSKENVFKKYADIDGQTYKIELYYTLGGYNMYSDTVRERGYYGAVTPVTRSTTSEGYTVETFRAYTGVCKLIYPTKRKSCSAARIAEDLFDDIAQQELLDYVVKSMEK